MGQSSAQSKIPRNAKNDFLFPRRDMARGLAKLEGELTRVGSWAAMRRDKEEAYR